MNKLVEQFVTNLSAGDVWVGFLMLGIFYVLKKEPFKVFSHLNEKKIKDVEQAKSLLESNRLGEESNELLREHIEHYAFRKFYGISARKDMRSALLDFYQKNQSSIGWRDLKRAYPYVKLDGPSIKVEISWVSYFWRWFVTCLSLLVGLYSLLIIALAFFAKGDGQFQFIALTFMSVALLVAAMIFSSINWPFHSAVKIKGCLEKSLENEVNSES